ncbi:MAG TPA: peptidylprolyl isomerase [Vicinamibacteria bacterium]|nr:peptidylprolyl isomerase [Vicinamibacteria bacterium]
MNRLLSVLSLLIAAGAPGAAKDPVPMDAVVVTTEGTFVIRLLPEVAPAHVRHFEETARTGGYDGTTFHRIIPGGVVQGGDPFSKDPSKVAQYGKGGLGLLKAEVSDRPFSRGTVAAVRRPSSLDSGGSQFFVCLSDQPALKGQYTIFGQVVEGMDVLDRISGTPVDGDKPRARIEMKSVTLRPTVP